MRQHACTARKARQAAPDPLRPAAATFGALFWIVGWPIVVAAQAEPGFALRWTAPSECPDSTMIERAVAGYLQGDLLRAELRAVARIERAASGAYALTLQLDHEGARAERTLSGGDCTALAQAAALLIAIAIDPSLEARATSTAPKPDTPDAAAASGTTTTAQPPPTAPSPESQPAPNGAPTRTPDESSETSDHASAWGVALAFVLDAGSLPGVGLGGGAALELRLAWMRFALGGQVLAAGAQSLPALGDAAVHLAGAMGIARACARLRVGDALEFGPCGEVEFGALWGHTSGIEDPRRGATPWVALGPGIEGRALLGAGFALVADAGLLVPTARARFFVHTAQGPVSAHRVNALALRAALAIAYEFR